MLDRTLAPPARAISDLKLPSPQYAMLGNKYPALLVPDPNHPVISIEIMFKGGKWYERNIGTSFYAAKMIAEGTPKLSSEEIARRFDSTGSYLEIISGADWVVFKIHTLKRFFESALTLFFELLAEASLPEAQYRILQELRRQNIQNQISKNNQYANLKISQQLFGEDHPYGRQLSPEMAMEVELEAVREFLNDGLVAAPTFVVIGDFEDRLDLIESLALQLQVAQPAPKSFEVISGAPKWTEERTGSTQASIRIAGLSIGQKHADIHGFTLTHKLLGGFFGSRLMKNIREEKGLTYSISSQIVHLTQEAYWIIGSDVEKENVDLAVSEIYKEIDQLKETLVSDQELDLMKNYVRGKMLSSIDSSFSLARIYKSPFLNGLSKEFLETYLQTLDEITPTDIRDMSQRYLHPTHQVVIT